MNWRVTLTMLAVLIVSFGILFYVSKRKSSHTKAVGNDTIIVGTNAEYQPFSFIENNKIVGFDIDVIKEIAQRLEKKIEIKNMSFAALIPELQLGSIYVIAAGVTPSEEKAKRVFFTTIYFDNDPLMAVQPISASPISNAEGLKNKIVSVNQGYTADQYLSNLNGFTILRVSSPLVNTGILTLQGNQADVYVASKSALKPYFEKQKETHLQATPIEGTEETYALAVSKKYPKLYNAIETTLKTIINDGTLEKIKKKWGLA